MLHKLLGAGVYSDSGLSSDPSHHAQIHSENRF